MAVSKKLTSLEVLGMAIKSEIEAAELYRKLINKIKNPALKEKIQFLVAEEQKHRRIFEDIFKKNFPEVELELAATSQVPNMDKALREDLTVEKIFQIAMEAERISQNFYAELALESSDLTGKAMYEYLSGVESGHYNLLKTEYDFLVKFPAYYETEDFLSAERLIHVGP